ncbi:MAG: hypothetical protein KGL39_13015 [Patescibacteria group bacterium]|nr:hypothetical protein [Patescibacteria group bacterium]
MKAATEAKTTGAAKRRQDFTKPFKIPAPGDERDLEGYAITYTGKKTTLEEEDLTEETEDLPLELAERKENPEDWRVFMTCNAEEYSKWWLENINDGRVLCWDHQDGITAEYATRAAFEQAFDPPRYSPN